MMGHFEDPLIVSTPEPFEFEGYYINSIVACWLSTFFIAEGFLWCFGYNEWGQLGLPLSAKKKVIEPQLVSTINVTQIVQVAPGRAHTIWIIFLLVLVHKNMVN